MKPFNSRIAVLAVTSLFTAMTIIACGKKDDKSNKNSTQVRQTNNNNKNNAGPLGPQKNSDLGGSDDNTGSQTVDQLNDGFDRTQNQIKLFRVGAQKSCFSENETSDAVKTDSLGLSSLVNENKSGLVWSLVSVDVKYSSKNSESKLTNQVTFKSTLSDGKDAGKILDDKENLLENKADSKIICHTSNEKNKEALQFQINIPMTIDQKSGEILSYQQRVVLAKNNSAGSSVKIYKSQSKKTIQSFDKSDVIEAEVKNFRVIEAKEDLAVIEVKTKMLLSKNIEDTKTIILVYKSEKSDESKN